MCISVCRWYIYTLYNLTAIYTHVGPCIYTCGTLYIHMWYPVYTHALPCMYTCGTLYILMWYPVYAHVAPCLYICGALSIDMWYIVCTHVVPCKQYMGTAQVTFVVEQCGAVTSPEVIVCACATGSCITGSCITENEVTGNDVTGNEREIISHLFYPYFHRFFLRNSSRFQVRTMEL